MGESLKGLLQRPGPHQSKQPLRTATADPLHLQPLQFPAPLLGGESQRPHSRQGRRKCQAVTAVPADRSGGSNPGSPARAAPSRSLPPRPQLEARAPRPGRHQAQLRPGLRGRRRLPRVPAPAAKELASRAAATVRGPRGESAASSRRPERSRGPSPGPSISSHQRPPARTPFPQAPATSRSGRRRSSRGAGRHCPSPETTRGTLSRQAAHRH